MLNLDPIWQPETQQSIFRTVLDAIAHPGRCYGITPLPRQGSPALGVLATLLDAEVTLADPHNMLNKVDWPMLQAKQTNVEEADYIIVDGHHRPDFSPKLGTLPSPEQSATVIILVDRLNTGDCQLACSGPGIYDTQKLSLGGLNRQWLSAREDWIASFPLGIDVILFDHQHLVALPRTTRVEVI